MHKHMHKLIITVHQPLIGVVEEWAFVLTIGTFYIDAGSNFDETIHFDAYELARRSKTKVMSFCCCWLYSYFLQRSVVLCCVALFCSLVLVSYGVSFSSSFKWRWYVLLKLLGTCFFCYI